MTRKRFDICVLGNAVVDGFARVSEETLEKFHLHKGDYAHLSHELFLEINHDIILEHFSAGGSGANVISSLSALGFRAAHLGRLGDDPAGKHFYNDMNQNFTWIAQPDATVRTLQIFILLTPDGERTFLEPTTSALITPEFLDANVIADSKVLLLEGYPLLDQMPAVLKAISAAHQANIPVILMLAPPSILKRATAAFMKVIAEAKVDLIFSDTGEAACMESLLEGPALAAWKSTPRVQTMGGDGAKFIHPQDSEIFAPCEKIEMPVDLTGAGEAFAAGFLAGYLRHEEPLKCLMYGHKLGGKVIQQMGARLTGLTREILQDDEQTASA